MIEKMIEKKISRRNALQSLGLMGAGAALSACIQQPPVMAQGPTDADILNFALNLEYLEAEFYLQAVFGRGLSAADAGNGPASTGGRMATFATPEIRQFAEEIALDEEAHVRFLRSALGGAAVARPAINIGTAFAAAANAAFNRPASGALLDPAFDPYANELFFLHGAFIFEDVGVTAYKGAAPLIANKGTLEAAAGILGVEAYHAGEIRTLLYQQRNVQTPYGVPVSTVVQAISNLRDSVDGGDDRDQGIVGANGATNPGAGTAANIVPTDANAIAFSRSVSQVLRIVYLGGTSSGGFFPNGLNHPRADFKTAGAV